jgi:hypothetical protein
LRRRREAYHDQIERTAGAPGDPGKSDHDSIHDRQPEVSAELRQALAVDPQNRFSLQDRLLHQDAEVAEVMPDLAAADGGDFVDAPYDLVSPPQSDRRRGSDMTGWRVPQMRTVICSRKGRYRDRTGQVWPLQVQKEITLDDAKLELRVSWRWRNESDAPVAFRFASEWNLALLQHETYLDDGTERPAKLSAGELGRRQSLILHVPPFGSSLHWHWQEPCELWVHEIETVSQAESGLELNYQGHMLLPLWDVQLAVAEEARFGLTFSVAGGSATQEP